MRSLFFRLTVYLFLFALTVGECAFAQSEQEHGADRKTKTELNKAFGALNFIENKGQWEPEVLYLATVNEQRMWFTKHGLRLDLFEMEVLESSDSNQMAASIDQQIPAEMKVKGHVFDMELLNASANYEVMEADCNPGYYNYFLGNDPEKWVRRAASYTELWRRDAYPGIDVHYYPSTKGLMEYDFIVAPHTDPSQIVMRYSGLDRYSLDEEGNLLLITALGDVPISRPYSYQIIDGQTQTIASNYILDADGTISFEFPDGYDVNHPLVIDPMILEWSTYLSGSIGWAWVLSMDVTPTGECMVTGLLPETNNFPTTPGAYTSITSGQSETFVTKLDSTGSFLIYSTIIGGSWADRGQAIAIDDDGCAIITGWTNSPDFPTLNGFSLSPVGGTDAFVTKLSASGDDLLFSSYLGGSSAEDANAIAVDSQNNIYVGGITFSSNFPTTAGAFSGNIASYADAFITKIPPSGTTILESTYFGGLENDEIHTIAIDSQNSIVIAGYTLSPDLPTTPGCYDGSLAPFGTDGFLAKFSNLSSPPAFVTYIGGNDHDYIQDLAIDDSNNIVAIGATSAGDFPTTPGVIDESFNGFQDGFVCKFSSDGTTLQFSTLIGGTDFDILRSVCLDENQDIFVLGFSNSTNFPTTLYAISDSNLGLYDIVVSKISASGDALYYSTYFGGSQEDNSWQGASLKYLDKSVYGVSITGSADFNTTSNAYQSVKPNPFTAGVVFKLTFTCPDYAQEPDISTPSTICSDTSFSFSVANTVEGSFGSVLTVYTPSGIIYDTLDGEFDHLVQVSLNNVTSYCKPIRIDLPWNIRCLLSGDTISSGVHPIDVFPSAPTALADVMTIDWNTTTCQWDITPQNDCDLFDISTFFDITPDPNTWPANTCNGGVQEFTITYEGAANGLNCCPSTTCSFDISKDYSCCSSPPEVPANYIELVDCFYVPDEPTPSNFPIITDACGNVLTPTIIPPDTINTEECNDVIWTLVYTDCAGNITEWLYIFDMISYEGVFIPNSFTPNNDGINDEFYAVIEAEFDPSSYIMRLYNRWGELVWESLDPTARWDGSFNDAMVQSGSLVWELTIRLTNSAKVIRLDGHVNVLR